MNVITPHALAVLLKGHAEGEMVYVRIKDGTGYRFAGRVLSMQEVKAVPRISTVDVEAEDGEVVWAEPVHRITAVDVVPFRRYTGLTVAQFVDGATAGM